MTARRVGRQRRRRRRRGGRRGRRLHRGGQADVARARREDQRHRRDDHDTAASHRYSRRRWPMPTKASTMTRIPARKTSTRISRQPIRRRRQRRLGGLAAGVDELGAGAVERVERRGRQPQIGVRIGGRVGLAEADGHGCVPVATVVELADLLVARDVLRPRVAQPAGVRRSRCRRPARQRRLDHVGRRLPLAVVRRAVAPVDQRQRLLRLRRRTPPLAPGRPGRRWSASPPTASSASFTARPCAALASDQHDEDGDDRRAPAGR